MRFLPFAFLLIVAGCTTVEFVRKDLTPRRQAVLKYPPQSDPKDEAKYRQKLDEEARGFCPGGYEIVREYEAREETGATGVGTGVRTGVGFGTTGVLVGTSRPTTSMFRFVELVCK